MEGNISDRCVAIGEYMLETQATVRAAAKKFGVSKSTVFKDVTDRLKIVNPALAREVHKVLEFNKAERHIRGGLATKRKHEQNCSHI